MIEYRHEDIKHFIKTSIITFALLISVFLCFVYFYSKKYIINEIDKRLLVAAESIKYILPPDYHDRAVKPGGITDKEYALVERKLTQYAERVGIRYIWTDIEYNGDYYLTSCNTKDESRDEGPEIFYFMKYSDGISEDEIKAFNSDKPVFTFLNDRWGHFRAVFIPSVSPYGYKYLSCAEYTVDYVDKLLRNSTIFTLIVSIMLFILFTPLFATYIVYAGNKEKELRIKNKELEEISENLNITLHSISDGVIVTDNKGFVRMMNRTAEDITGYKQEDYLNNDISEIMKIHDVETMKEIECPVKEVIKSGKPYNIMGNAVVFRQDGKKIRISKSAAPIKSAENSLTGVVVVIRDITDQFRLEEEIRQSRNIESVGQLAGGIAHDFNNMLGAVLSSAELLQLQVNDNKAQKYIGIIIDTTHKAAELTSNLLTFSRKKNKNIVVFNINRALNNVINILQRTFEKNILIKTYLNAASKYLKGDIGEIENTIYNLAANSRDAMPEGGLLEIITDNIFLDRTFCENTVFDIAEGNYIVIKIKDTGSGISRKDINKIFDPYFTAGKEKISGGIGLSVVYGTVVEHKGAVYAESSPEKGTVFTLYLPVHEDMKEY